MFTIFPLFNFQFPYLSLLSLSWWFGAIVSLVSEGRITGTRLRFACQEFFGTALGNITCEEWKKQDWAEGFELRCLCNRGFSWSYSVCRRAGMSQLSHLGIRWLSFFLKIPFIDQLLSAKSPWKWAQGNFFQLRAIPGEWFSQEL